MQAMLFVRRTLPGARVLLLSAVMAGALFGARSLPGAHAAQPAVEHGTSGPAAAYTGQTVTYTVTVRNPNAQAVPNLVVSLAGDDTASFVDFNAGAGLSNCAQFAINQRIGVSCSLASLAAGAQTSLSMRVTLGDAAAPSYSVLGYGGPSLSRGLLNPFVTQVIPATTAPPTKAPPAQTPPDYDGNQYEPNAGPFGAA